MAFAEHSFGLDVATDDGGTRRQHLLSAARQLGETPLALQGPSFPEPLAYLWRHFNQIHNGRTINGMSHTRATQLDIWAWQQNNGVHLEPWEIRAVSNLGTLWLNVQIEADSKRRPQTPPPKPTAPRKALPR